MKHIQLQINIPLFFMETKLLMRRNIFGGKREALEHIGGKLTQEYVTWKLHKRFRRLRDVMSV